MLSCEVQLAWLPTGNFNHRLASCRFAFYSSFTQLFIDWSTERPVVAATSSLQLSAMSNFGTLSATGTTNCVPNTIIETVIGIFGLPIGPTPHGSASHSVSNRASWLRLYGADNLKTGQP
jgi:hypothetical protein